MKLQLLLSVILATASGALISFGMYNMVARWSTGKRVMGCLALAAACGYLLVKL